MDSLLNKNIVKHNDNVVNISDVVTPIAPHLAPVWQIKRITKLGLEANVQVHL